jgi:hypothetical protein
MKYKGMELVEITSPQVFDPPKKMLVWDYNVMCNEPSIQTVYAVIMKETGTKQAIGECCRWSHCAAIPEDHKPRRATNRELAKWLSANKGEYRNHIGLVSNAYTYDVSESDTTVPSLFKLRKWDDTDWHEPTVDYMAIDDKQVGTSHVARYVVTDKYGNQYSVRCTENGLKLFPTPVSLEKAEEIFSLALKQFPELANGNTNKG